MVKAISNQQGQTVIEFILLTAVAAFTAILILPQFGTFTANTIGEIKGRLGSVAKDGELSETEKQPGQVGHPGHKNRFKELHF
jgi:hypothetical protein